jgi:hypothetical protein
VSTSAGDPADGAVAVAVLSITVTKRRRHAWAAWWTGAPQLAPFRKPDAAGGGAATEAEARAAAERAAGRHLVSIAPFWARAWNEVLRGRPPPPWRDPTSARPRPSHGATPAQLLGLTDGASLDEIKRAFRQLALTHHPDHGGDAARFRELRRAYASLVGRRRP